MITETFFKYFDVHVADSQSAIEAYKIRYQVYCDELSYLDAKASPNGLETDEFDEYSTHLLLLHRSTGKYVGTVRLVVPPASTELKTPVETFCLEATDPEILDLNQLPNGRYCEISRLAVHSHFRRRKNEAQKPFVYDGIRTEISSNEQANFPYIAVGLYVASAACLIVKNLDHAVIMMEPRLARLLTRQGVYCEMFGEEIDYHGRRAPYYITPEIFRSGIKGEIEQLLKMLEHRIASQLNPPED